MEVDGSDRAFMSIVMLKQLARAQIPQLDRLVMRARCNSAAVGMEHGLGNDVLVVEELADALTSFSIPHSHTLIITSRHLAITETHIIHSCQLLCAIIFLFLNVLQYEMRQGRNVRNEPN